MTERERGWVAKTPKEVDQVWADARRAVRAEAPAMRRRQLTTTRGRLKPGNPPNNRLVFCIFAIFILLMIAATVGGICAIVWAT